MSDEPHKITPEKQAKMAEMIGKLIAMSEDESLAKEARASYAEKAEQLMRKYRIDEENVISSGSEAASLPQAFRIVLVEGMGYWYAGEFQSAYRRLWNEIKNHAGLLGHMEWVYEGGEVRHMVAIGYGYEIDIRLAQFLWTAAHLTFATRIDTKFNPSLSDQENCYYMRASGMERRDIAKRIWGSDEKDGTAHGRVHRLYLAECSKRGEEPSVGGKGFQGKRYREAYAEGFVDQFGWRLRDARSSVDSREGGLVLHGRKERVEAAYWEAHPEKAPETEEQAAERRARYFASSARQAEEERICGISGNCAAAVKRATTKLGRGLYPHELETAKCRKHRPYEATASDKARWDREANSPERSAGRRAGSAAASSVEFRRTGGNRTHKSGSAERPALG